VLYSREGTVQKVIQKIAELARLEVQFATFPETVVPWWYEPVEMVRQRLGLMPRLRVKSRTASDVMRTDAPAWYIKGCWALISRHSGAKG
jgi:hypothetical protein